MEVNESNRLRARAIGYAKGRYLLSKKEIAALSLPEEDPKRQKVEIRVEAIAEKYGDHYHNLPLDTKDMSFWLMALEGMTNFYYARKKISNGNTGKWMTQVRKHK